MQTPSDYKSGKQLHQLYQKVRDKQGRFMINIGPNADGTLDPREEQSLSELFFCFLTF